MSNINSSANMSLPIPVAGIDPGPDWSLNLNSCLTIIDGHDHSAGNGVQINPAGININADLTFLQNNAISLRSVRFTSQSAVLSDASDLDCLYTTGVDLYFNDGNGNNVRITQSGGVAGTPGSISNLTSPASASYVSADQTFVWQSDANTPANLDAASIILRNLTANSNGLTLNPPSAMGANYSLTLPSLPASQKIMTLDASGNMSAPYVVDGSTVAISANTILVPAGGITTTQIASATIVSGNIAAHTIVAGNIVAGTITTTEIASATIVNANISASAAIVGSKLATNPNFTGIAQSNSQNVVVGATNAGMLQICRGTIEAGSGSPTPITGDGFSVSFIGVNVYRITFTHAFQDAPAVCFGIAYGMGSIEIDSPTTTGYVQFKITSTQSGIFSFIAIGIAT